MIQQVQIEEQYEIINLRIVETAENHKLLRKVIHSQIQFKFFPHQEKWFCGFKIKILLNLCFNCTGKSQYLKTFSVEFNLTEGMLKYI